MPRPIGEKQKIAERQRQVMEKRMEFKSLDEIWEWWNHTHPTQQVSRATIGNDIKHSLETSIKETGLATKEWRQLHIKRIEKVLSSQSFQSKLNAADLWAVDRFIKMQDQLIKLTGAGIKDEPAPGEQDRAGGFGSLTDEERYRLMEELLERARQRRQDQSAHEESEEEYSIQVVRKVPQRVFLLPGPVGNETESGE